MRQRSAADGRGGAVREHDGNHDVGFIGEEVGKVLPEVVVYEPDGRFVTGMDYSKMTPLLVEAVKALRAE